MKAEGRKKQTINMMDYCCKNKGIKDGIYASCIVVEWLKVAGMNAKIFDILIPLAFATMSLNI